MCCLYNPAVFGVDEFLILPQEKKQNHQFGWWNLIEIKCVIGKRPLVDEFQPVTLLIKPSSPSVDQIPSWGLIKSGKPSICKPICPPLNRHLQPNINPISITQNITIIHINTHQYAFSHDKPGDPWLVSPGHLSPGPSPDLHRRTRPLRPQRPTEAV